MTTLSDDNPLGRLADEVRGYRAGPFSLADDLDRLRRVHEAGAPEAVVLYGARILDALTSDSLAAIELDPSPNVFSNLEALEQLNVLRTPTLSWAHGLRRLGNLVRHVKGRIGPDDAEVSLLFAERWLDWFFCHSPGRPRRLERLCPDGRPFALSGGTALRAVLHEMDAPGFNPRDLLARPSAEWGVAQKGTPALSAVAAEMLLDRRDFDAAREVVQQALARFPDDLRLNQLQVLYWSRIGRPEDALPLLEPLRRRSSQDEETAGITAGVYKRLWLADKSHRDWLRKSRETYRDGWKWSRQGNPYLGVNAAATAVWLIRAEGPPAAEEEVRRRKEVRPAAEAVRQLLQGRADALARIKDNTDLHISYWDRVSLAEAELLLGDFDAARREYLAAFGSCPDFPERIAVASRQLGEHLAALGLPDTPETFLAG